LSMTSPAAWAWRRCCGATAAGACYEGPPDRHGGGTGAHATLRAIAKYPDALDFGKAAPALRALCYNQRPELTRRRDRAQHDVVCGCDQPLR
jgi:hypothetical protein